METLSQIASSIDEYLPETEHTLFTHRSNQFIESFERKRASNEIIETKNMAEKITIYQQEQETEFETEKRTRFLLETGKD